MLTQTIPTKHYFYSEYRDLVLNLAEKSGTTGPEQSSERIEATKLNAQRIKRLDKTIIINESLALAIKKIDKKWNWTVLIESWCGDGAQNIPIIAKMASLNNNIDLKFIQRDENPDVMDKYLTNGSRSIPILICTDVTTGIVLGTWGSRPKHIAELAKNFKLSNPNIAHEEFLKNLHLEYAKDKGESIQKDFILQIRSWQENAITG